MGLTLKTFCAGPLQNNVILVINDETRQCVLIDPTFEPQQVINFIKAQNLVVEYILFTHGHFDHFAGLAYALTKISPPPKIGLHPDDLALWQDGGGSKHFRMPIEVPVDPDLLLEDKQKIMLGDYEIEVRHTPGHSPGSVIFYVPSIKTAVVGDLVFHHGIGRTDLDGGSFKKLANSIHSQVLSLPPETVLIPGHGAETTVREEMEENPYVGLHSNFDDSAL